MAETDFEGAAGYVEFDVGESFINVTVTLVNDEVLEDLEMFSATLISFETNVIVEETSSRADIFIVDNDREYLFLPYIVSKQQTLNLLHVLTCVVVATITYSLCEHI